MKKNGPTLRKVNHILRRNGLEAGKRYASKHGILIPGPMLQTAAQWWSRKRERDGIKRDLLPNGTHANKRRAWKLFQLRREEMAHEQA